MAYHGLGLPFYRRKLREYKARLAAVGDHPRLADEVFWSAFAQAKQLRQLKERAVSLGA
jgi:hypothetical protein